MDERERKHRKLRELWGRVARRSGSPAQACPDPEILSAFFMHMLGKEETAHWEAHFSVCSACQEVLAALVKTASAEEIALASEGIREHESGGMEERLDAAAQLSRLSESEPALVEEVAMAAAPAAPPAVTKPVSVQPAQARPSPRERFSWRWFVPAVAAAVVLAVWLTVRFARPGSQSGVQVAENEPAVQPVNPETPPSAPAASSTANKEKREATKLGATSGDVASANSALARQSATKDVTKPSSTGAAEADSFRIANGAKSNPKVAASPAPPPVSASGENRIKTADGQIARDRAVTPAAKPSGVEAGAVPQAAPPLQQPAVKSSQKVTAAEEAAQSETSARTMPYREEKPAAGLGGTRTVQALEATSAKAMPKSRGGAQFFAPGRKVVWSVGPGGLLLRSPDSGVSWMREESGVKADLLSGSAPSDTVCWVVGRAGTVLLTTDGYHWSKLASPGTQDWIGVQAMDALHAVIWDFNRAHKFSTADGGQTWQGAPQ